MLLYQNLGIEENEDLTTGLIVMESSLSYHWQNLRWQNLRRVGKNILKGLSNINKMSTVSLFPKKEEKKRTNTVAASTR